MFLWWGALLEEREVLLQVRDKSFMSAIITLPFASKESLSSVGAGGVYKSLGGNRTCVWSEPVWAGCNAWVRSGDSRSWSTAACLETEMGKGRIP